MNHRWQIGHRFRTPSTRRRQSSLGGRNCGKVASGIDQCANASGEKPVLGEKLAAFASTLMQKAFIPQLRPWPHTDSVGRLCGRERPGIWQFAHECLSLGRKQYVQGQEDTSAGGEWATVDGDRDEDLGQGGDQLLEGGAREAVVDDSVVLAGVRGFLSDVHGHRAEVFGKDPCSARAHGAHLQDFQPQGVSHHCLYGYAGDYAQVCPGHSADLLRLVLSRAGGGPAFRGNPFPHPMVEGERH